MGVLIGIAIGFVIGMVYRAVSPTGSERGDVIYNAITKKMGQRPKVIEEVYLVKGLSFDSIKHLLDGDIMELRYIPFHDVWEVDHKDGGRTTGIQTSLLINLFTKTEQ